jgi:SAM-dependent methyltransferase
MIDRARERAAQQALDNVLFETGDAQIYAFSAKAYDVAISRYGLMFFSDMTAALANIRRAVKPGGRLVALAWQPLPRNEWQTEIFGALAPGGSLPLPPAGTPGPWGLADPATTRRILEESGWSSVDLAEADQPVYFGPSASQAFAWFRDRVGVVRGLLSTLDAAREHDALQRMQTVFETHQHADGVWMGSRSWLITAVA